MVLAGGGARRFGGGDKTAARVGHRTVLEHLVSGLPAGLPVAVVGPGTGGRAPELVAGRPVLRTREQPPGGGPTAGLAAGLAALPESLPAVVVLGGDQPFAAGCVQRLLRELDRTDADGRRPEVAAGVDPDGHRQPLVAAYRVDPLRRALAEAAPAGRRMRDVLAGLRVVDVPVTAREALDVDTVADLERARGLLAPGRAP